MLLFMICCRLDRTMQDIVAKLVPGILEGKSALKIKIIMK